MLIKIAHLINLMNLMKNNEFNGFNKYFSAVLVYDGNMEINGR